MDELLRQQERRRGPWVVPREVGAKRDFSDFLRAPRAGPRVVALQVTKFWGVNKLGTVEKTTNGLIECAERRDRKRFGGIGNGS